jgi:hypothetical protein
MVRHTFAHEWRIVGGEMAVDGARPTWARRATSSSGTDRGRYRDDTDPLTAEATGRHPCRN